MAEAQKLWVPGDQLDDVVQETPSRVELCRAFSEAVVPCEAVVPVPDALGAVVLPRREIRGFAFLDIDDTVHDLSGSMQALQHSTIRRPHERVNNHDYGEDMWFGDDEMPLKRALYTLIRTDGSAGLQLPEGFADIQRTIRWWRAAGIMTGFVSSLTPGSELPTITNFLGRHFVDNCDFVVIPDGHYMVSDKGVSVEAVMSTVIEQLEEPVPAIAIDDIGKHAKAMRVALESSANISEVQTIQPIFPSDLTVFPRDTESVHVEGSAAAFQAATQFFTKHLGEIALF